MIYVKVVDEEPIFTKEEQNVLMKVMQEMVEADDANTIRKIYRQARNWSRYHCYFEKACSPDMCKIINNKFKVFRDNAIENLM